MWKGKKKEGTAERAAAVLSLDESGLVVYVSV